MLYETIGSIGIILCIIVFVSISTFYFSIYKNKPLGMQTQLDIVYMDCIKGPAMPIFVIYFWFLSLIWIDPYPFYLSLSFALLIHVLMMRLHSYMFIYALVKATLIFQPTWLNDVPDVKFVSRSRKLVTVITVISIIIDFFTFDGHSPFVAMSIKDPNSKR